ncbi:MAG: DUF3047 domain-containing protein [Dissulfurispiraceae bacterium]
MSTIAFSLIAFAIIFGGTLLGMFLRALLSAYHLSADARDVMKLGTKMIAVMAAALLISAHAARAEHRAVVADFSSAVVAGGVPTGWELSEKSGKADLAVVKDEGVSAVRFRSADTSFSLQKKVKVDLKKFPMLTWEWKVTELPVGGDFRKSTTDGQAAQLFGSEPRAVSGIRRQINSQHTDTTAESYFSNVAFETEARHGEKGHATKSK